MIIYQYKGIFVNLHDKKNKQTAKVSFFSMEELMLALSFYYVDSVRPNDN